MKEIGLIIRQVIQILPIKALTACEYEGGSKQSTTAADC